MGIAERRERERERRRREILDAAWSVAESGGWPSFSMERVAAVAELGRATIYGYFPSLEGLIAAMADEALQKLSIRTSAAQSLAEALDAPVRFSQGSPAAFALLFPHGADPRPMFSSPELVRLREEAQQMVRALRRMAAEAGASLPEDAASAEAFLAGIAMAGATVPELRDSTPLRRRWQEFCLQLEAEVEAQAKAKAEAQAQAQAQAANPSEASAGTEPVPPQDGAASADKQG
jgi:AcrR family transcriptional regulator